MRDYEDISLEELETSRFFFDPNHPKFAQNLHKKNKVFAFEDNAVSNSTALKYIALLYDPESELRKNISHYPIRKRIAAKMAGFKTDSMGKFEKNVEEMLVGNNKYVNRAVAEYCFMTLNIYYVAHAAYVDMYFRALADSAGVYDKDTRQALDDLQKKILAHDKLILGGDEVVEMRKALYALSKKIELDFTPEGVVRKLESGDDLGEWSPYGKEYKVKKVKYAGHAIPK
jgi:hypothetical protein